MVKKPLELSIHVDTNRPLQHAIIKALLYFDIFNYPLTKEEILRYAGVKSNQSEVGTQLQWLVDSQMIFQFNEYYSIQNKKENIVRRIKGNEHSMRILPLARKKAELIGKFPFVRAVMASGSLSKGYMDETSDLDFFIVTSPGRLWIARMMLVIYKRLFLFNSHKYFCINYFVSEDHLEVEEKNQFTATELATVIPLYNHPVYTSLLASNGWLMRHFPNYVPRASDGVTRSNGVVKNTMEKLISLCGGNFFERFFMDVTKRRWSRLYKNQYDEKDFEIAFKSKNHSSKNHPKHYQKKITEQLEKNWRAYSEVFNLGQL